jgi:hypothetical protein
VADAAAAAAGFEAGVAAAAAVTPDRQPVAAPARSGR